MEKKKIMVDMDEVLCDGAFLNQVNKFLNTNYSSDDIKTYYVQDIIPRERYDEWLSFLENINIYDNCDTLKDCYEVLNKLSAIYDIYVVTAYIVKDRASLSGKLLKDKFDFLYKVFPFLDPNKYVFTNSKDIVNMDIRIDDKLSNLFGDNSKKLLLTAYHNKNITDKELHELGVIRVNDWKEIENLLLNMED